MGQAAWKRLTPTEPLLSKMLRATCRFYSSSTFADSGLGFGWDAAVFELLLIKHSRLSQGLDDATKI